MGQPEQHFKERENVLHSKANAKVAHAVEGWQAAKMLQPPRHLKTISILRIIY